MGNEHAKPVDKLKFIDREVNSLRSSVRSTRRNIPSQTKEEYIQVLARFSSEVGDLKGKVKNKHLEQTQKNISNAVNEVLTKVPASSETVLDMGAIETSSFIEVPVNKRQGSNKVFSSKPTKKQKSSQVDSAKRNTTLLDIEEKLKTLKPQINVAIENRDTTMLRLHQETTKVLAADLEMIDLTEDTPIADKKKKLEGNIRTQYQKITKAMKEIKRNKDIGYLVKQTKKEKAMKELEEIRKNLEETSATLKTCLKNKDSSSLKGIQDKLIAINQRLSSVEVTDEVTTSMKLDLMDQFKGIYTDINDNPKNSSQSDLSKAQANYEDIVKNIASGQNKDKEDIKIKLQSLQSFIYNIKENDADSSKRKEQLLNNVRQSFSFILDEKKVETSTGNGPKKVNTSYKELDSFYNNWKAVQKAIKSTTYSPEEVAKIDKLLRDVQNSIAHTRQQITGTPDEQSNIKTKLNYSTPNLSSSKARLNYDTSLSLDHSGQLIKTRAKVYNLSTPEIRNISDQPVVLRNKQFYKNYDFEDGHRFSKIEEIKTQVNYIKEKFSESQQKQHLKNKLESYVEILNEYVHHKNQATASNARIVLSDIQEMLKNMSHIQEAMNTAQRRMSVEDSLENIAGVQAAVDKIQKDIDAFSGTKEDKEYTELRSGLQECRQCLEDTRVPPKYDMIQQQKEQILKKISNLLETLESKNVYEDSHVTGIEEAVNKLQNAIVMFSGKKGDNEYTKIRDGLLECRSCLEDTIIPVKYEMLQKKKDELLKKIPHLFATLEIKSSNHQEDPVIVITRRNLANLKDRVRAFSGAYKGVLYNKLEKELNKLLLDVGNTIHDKAAVDEIIKDVEKHLNILEQRSSQDQNFRRNISSSQSRQEEEDKLVKLKSDLVNIKTAIDTTPANGVNLFLGLRSRLDLVKLELDQLKIMSDEEEKQKEMLYNEVETYRNIVEAKIGLSKQAIRQWPFEEDSTKRYEEEMHKIVEKFRSLKPEIENFVGTTSDNKFYELDESSIRLVLRMDKLQFTKGTDNYDKKINLLKELYGYGDLLDQRAKETEDIIEIERNVYDLDKNFERFLRLNDLQNLQDKVDKLQEKIINTETNRNLLDRKQRCAIKITALADKLKEIKENSNKEVVIIERDTRRISRDPANQISELERRFNYFQKEVEQFIGIHTDRKYIELEGNISILFSKLDNLQLPEESELHARKLKLLKEIQVYWNALDQRATETEIVREVVKQLNVLNSKVDDYRGSNEELKEMESELKSVESKLKKFKMGGTHRETLERKYGILLGEYNRFMKAKELPKNSYIGSTSFLEDVQNLNKTKASLNEEDSINTEISEIKKGIDEIRGQVEVFASSDSSEEYKKIEEDLLLLNVRVNKLDVPKANQLYKQKLELDKSIQHCFMVLDERAQEADILMYIEKEIEELGKKFDGIMSESEKNSIDEKLISLQVKLGKLHVIDDLNQRKNMCTNKIIIYSKQLSDKPNSRPNSNPEEEP